jgi:hypothetical protein
MTRDLMICGACRDTGSEPVGMVGDNYVPCRYCPAGKASGGGLALDLINLGVVQAFSVYDHPQQRWDGYLTLASEFNRPRDQYAIDALETWQ